MNTDHEYQRRVGRSMAEMQDLAEPRVEPGPAVARRSIVWVRPSELAMTVTTPALRRSADLQSELVRQGRRAPTIAVRAGRRITRSAIARPAPTTSSTEGMSL